MDPLVQAMMQAEYGPGQMRSEGTENEMARRHLGATPPVTVLGDLIGRGYAAAGNPAYNNANSFIDALRGQYMQKMMETGGPAVDNMGHTATYGQPMPPIK